MCLLSRKNVSVIKAHNKFITPCKHTFHERFPLISELSMLSCVQQDLNTKTQKALDQKPTSQYSPKNNDDEVSFQEMDMRFENTSKHSQVLFIAATKKWSH
jgi:hypothetical protein